MIKTITFCLLLIVSLPGQAQVNSSFPALPEESLRPGEHLSPQSLLPANFSLQSHFSITSRLANHHHYHIYYQNKPVLGARMQVTVDQNGKLQRISYTPLGHIDVAESSTFPAPRDQAVAENAEGNILSPSREVWVYHQNLLQTARSLEIADGEADHRALVYNDAGVLYQWDKVKQHHSNNPVDTTVSAYVFNPDPLSTAGVLYGTPYVDNGDNDVPELNAQRKLKDILITYDNGTFLLENEFVKVVDVSAPNIAPASNQNGDFLFTRAASGFEDVNALYHITTFKQHINKLGYQNIPGYQMEIDVHALNGDDNSMFVTSSNPRRLLFGEGYVDDAEDADVIVHEYTHALVLAATGNNNGTNERNTMEEALGDYFAASYSAANATFGNDRVFNWDGHNPFWPGRMVSSNKNYTQLSFNDIYTHTDIWASCLMDIYGVIGRDKTDELVLEAIFSLGQSTTMKDMALLIVDADLQFNQGVNRYTIVSAFIKRNILDYSHLDAAEPEGEKTLALYNSWGFSQGEDLWLEAGSSDPIRSLRLYNMRGEPIANEQFPQAVISRSFNHPALRSGMYLLVVELQSGYTATYKLLRN